MKSFFYQVLLFLPFLIAAAGIPGQAASGGTGTYRLDVRLVPATQQLEGEASLHIPADRMMAEVGFRLAEQAEVLEVTLNGQNATFRFSGDHLSVGMPSVSSPQPVSLFIRYRARFADALPETTVGMENPSFGVSATIGSVGAYLSSGTAWFPRPQWVPGQYRLRIEGPEGYIGVTSGKLLEHGTSEGRSYTIWETASPLDGLALSAGHFRICEEQIGGIQVLTFLTEQNAGLAQTYLDPAKKYLHFYQGLLGPYPYAKFAIVENFLPTGYGLPSLTLLGSNVVALPFIPNTSLPHEIVHSWFGNAVEVDYRSGNWAEGLTTYLSDYLLKEQRSAALGRDHRLKLLRDYAALVTPQQDYPLNRFISRTSKTDQAIGYGKSAMVFHMLRREIGEEAFWSALRRLATESIGKRLGWSDLREVFSEESGRDLTSFFVQWVERPGAPQLHFEDITVVVRAGEWIIRGMIVQKGNSYNFDLPLHIQTEVGTVETEVEARGRRTPFTLRTDAPILQLSGDPDAHLFRRLKADELPVTINDLRASNQLLIVARSAKDPLLEASADLLRGLQKQQSKIVPWDEFDPSLASGADLLFVGWPAGEMVDGESLFQVRATPGSFTWQGIEYRSTADSLFLCRKSTNSGQHLIALFHPLSADAAHQVARKIPHYGRYSYLVFKDGANLVKETAAADRSLLDIRFGQDPSGH